MIQENFESQHQILFPWIFLYYFRTVDFAISFLKFYAFYLHLNHFGKQTTPIKKSLLFSEFCNVVSKSPFGMFKNVLRLESSGKHFDIMNLGRWNIRLGSNVHCSSILGNNDTKTHLVFSFPTIDLNLLGYGALHIK